MKRRMRQNDNERPAKRAKTDEDSIIALEEVADLWDTQARKIKVGLYTFSLDLYPRDGGIEVKATEEATQDEFCSVITPEMLHLTDMNLQEFSDFLETVLFRPASDLQVKFGFCSQDEDCDMDGASAVDDSKLTDRFTAGDKLVVQIEQRIRWRGKVSSTMTLNWKDKKDEDKLRDTIHRQNARIALLERRLEYAMQHIPKPLLTRESIDFMKACLQETLNAETVTLRPLFDAKKHGGTAQNFHSMCNNRGPTITVVRDTEGNVFGGFNPESWQSLNQYKNPPTAFLFVIKFNGFEGPRKFNVQSGNCNNVVYEQQNYGPTFGANHDLHIHTQCFAPNNYTHFGGTFETAGGLGGHRKFVVDNYQVLQVCVD